MEFKVGDRVRLICCRSYGTIVKEKEMLGTRLHYTVLFDYDETDCLVPEEDLEIVDEDGKTLLEQRMEKLEEQIKDCIKYSQLTPVPEEELKIGGYHTIKGTPDIKLCGTNEETKPSLLTEDERVILRNLEDDYKWIVRDETGWLTIHEMYPYINNHHNWVSNGDSNFFDLFNHIFQFIKWGDKPYNIEELLKGECGNE